MRLAIPGRVLTKGTDEPEVNSHEIAPQYFEVLHIPFVAGRDFWETDREGFPRVAIVNKTLAKRLFGEKLPLDHAITLNDQRYQIVGLVKDAQIQNALEGPVSTAYLPFWQNDTEQQIDARMCVVRRARQVPCRLRSERQLLNRSECPSRRDHASHDQVRKPLPMSESVGIGAHSPWLFTLGLSEWAFQRDLL